MFSRITFSLLFGVLPYFLLDSASRGNAAERTLDRTIDHLIVDLGSDRFETREAATRALKERVDAIPALRKARRSSDLEVRHRVNNILFALGQKRAAQGLDKAKALGNAGRVVEVADRLAFAAQCGIAGDEGWESLTRFADQLITCTERSFGPSARFPRIPDFPAGEFRQFAKRYKPKEIAGRTIVIDTGNEHKKPKDAKEIAASCLLSETGGRLLLRGEEVSLTGRTPVFGLVGGMIAASGDVRLNGAIRSIIIAGGTTKIAFFHGCILICDGNVELLSHPGQSCLIVARGKVTWASGPVRNCIIRSGHTLHLPGGKTIDLKDGTPDPFAFVKFFELTDMGLTAEDLSPRERREMEGVRLKEMSKKSPFVAGLRAGDVITALEEKKTPTTEIFRRLLRRKLAEGEPIITFTVRRSGKTLNVPIAVKD